MTESTKQSTIAEISAYFNSLNLSIFTDPRMILKIQEKHVKTKKGEDFAKKKAFNFNIRQFAKKLEQEEARIDNEIMLYTIAQEEGRRYAEAQEARRFAEAQEARRFAEVQEAMRFAEVQEAMRFAEAQEEARRFAEAQEEAMRYEKANRFYSKHHETPRIKLPSQGRKTPSPPPTTPNFTDLNEFIRISEDHKQYMHMQFQQYQQRSISPPRFFYDKGMMHIINQ